MPLLPLLTALSCMSAALIAHGLRSHDPVSETQFFWVGAYAFAILAFGAFALFAVAQRRRTGRAFVVAAALIAASTVATAVAFGTGADAFETGRAYWYWLLPLSAFGAVIGIANHEVKDGRVWQKIAKLWLTMLVPAAMTFYMFCHGPQPAEFLLGLAVALMALTVLVAAVARALIRPS